MKRTFCLITCLVLLINSLVIITPQTVTSAFETDFQNLLETLDNGNENEIIIWTEDVSHDIIEQVTFMKTGLTKDKITNNSDIEEIQNYIRTKRDISRKVYETANNSFYTSVIEKTKSTVLFQSRYSPVFI